LDRYVVAVPPAERLMVEVQAAELGSWLDSWVTLEDSLGDRLAEGDDRGSRSRTAAWPGPGATDTLVEAEPRGDRLIVIAISDRFGDGGPEYPYRLRAGPP